MNTFFIVFSIVSLSWLMIKYYKKRKRELLALELSSIYDKMEINFIQNNDMDNDEIEYIKIYKSVATNPWTLDIRCILVAHQEMKKQENKTTNSRIDEIDKSQGEEFIELRKEFGKIAARITKLSLFNSGFLLVVCIVLFKSLLSFDTKGISNKLKKWSKRDEQFSPKMMNYTYCS